MSIHEETQADLAAYAASRLEGPALRRVEEHLGACEECRLMAQSFKALARAMREEGESLLEPHPDGASLRQFALARAGTGSVTIARHLAACSSCALEADAWRRVPTGRPSSARTSFPRWASMMVATAAGLAAGFGLAALVRAGKAPMTSSQVARGSSAPAAIDAAVGPLLVLPFALRGDGAPVRYEIDPKQSFVVIACPASIPDGAAPGDRFLYEIRLAVAGAGEGGGAREGETVWSTTMTAAEIHRHMAGSAAAVTLMVPTAQVALGAHEFRLAPAERPQETLYRAALEFTARP